ncbi:MAG: carboxypeptidase-like regulatory domain-containing protein [Candidatus Hydrogenedentes bacterium]|nr:carboxypeptidase-like regulatory domain-containing protein [Candidatus Hydrogenedentota bacterium]
MTPSIEMRTVSVLLNTLFLTLLTAGCSNDDSPTQVSTPAPSVAPAAQHTSPKTAVARMVVVDMEGNPVAGMLPIATKQPNAFDAPVAKGEITGANGQTSIVIPIDQRLYIRAWDPTKKVFANNFYEVLPGEGFPAEQLRIVMLPAATLEMEVMAGDGGTIADQPVGMMMSHPSRGPWWPSETTTDADGRARFEFVPPGEYAITLESRDGRHTDLPTTVLLPGQPTRLGPVILK